MYPNFNQMGNDLQYKEIQMLGLRFPQGWVVLLLMTLMSILGCGSQGGPEYDPVEHIETQWDTQPFELQMVKAGTDVAIEELLFYEDDVYPAFHRVRYDQAEVWHERQTQDGTWWAYYAYPDFGVNTLTGWYCGTLWLQCPEWGINASVCFHDWGCAIPTEIYGERYEARHNCLLDETVIEYYSGNDFVRAYIPPLDWDSVLERIPIGG